MKATRSRRLAGAAAALMALSTLLLAGCSGSSSEAGTEAAGQVAPFPQNNGQITDSVTQGNDGMRLAAGAVPGMEEVTDANFNASVLNSRYAYFLFVVDGECLDCREFAYKIWDDTYGMIKVGILDYANNPKFGYRYPDISTPSLLIFKDGRLVSKEAVA